MARTIVFILIGALAVYLAYDTFDIFDPESIKGKHVLVTGASSGIGEQMAYHYARMGASIVLTARRETLLQKVVEKCKLIGAKTATFDYIIADMSKLEQTKGVVETAVKTLGGLDYLMLNHAAMPRPAFWNSTSEDLKMVSYVTDTNFLSFVHLTSYAMPYLVRSKGHIGVMASIAGKNGPLTLVEYSASKFALVGFFNTFQKQQSFVNAGVSITVIMMGWVETETAVQRAYESNMNWFLRKVPFASASDAALESIRGTQKRLREIWFPAFWKYMAFLENFNLIASLLEWYNQHLMISNGFSFKQNRVQEQNI